MAEPTQPPSGGSSSGSSGGNARRSSSGRPSEHGAPARSGRAGPPRPGARERAQARGVDRAPGRPGQGTGDRPAGPRPPADPPVPAEVTWYDLDAMARRELQSLPKELAERVGGQLAAAGLAIDDDPEAAYAHAATARRLASRVAVTREALGLAAYAMGKYDQAIAELRAYRRLSGDESHLPFVADSERGLGRPERALELASSPAAATLDPSGRRELRIVVAGARRDMGQVDAARVLLEQDAELRTTAVDDSVIRLRYAYADTLLAAGRTDEAKDWFGTVAEQDTAGLTDSVERLAELTSPG